MAFGVPLTQAQIDEWIRSSEPNWTQRLGDGWVGKKFLGKGMFGIAGLWSYEGPAESAPAVKHVVVKQISFDMAHNEAPWGEMTGLSEGKILQKLAKVQTKHIVKMYVGIRFPIAKIADFGEAAEVKSINRQDNAYGAEFTRRGNQEMQAPEQTMSFPLNAFKSYPVQTPRKGTCSNIFQLGCVMNCLLLGQKLHFNIQDTVLEKSDLNPRLRGNWHHATGLTSPEITQNYSKQLRELITECLLREPLLRPSAIDLVTRCRTGKKTSLAALHALGIPASNPPSNFLSLPFAALKPPEPPEEWVNDLNTFEYDLADETFSDMYNIPSVGNTPTGVQRFGGLLGAVQSGLTPPATPGRILGYFGRRPGLGGGMPSTPPRTPPPSGRRGKGSGGSGSGWEHGSP